jgi:hypothetical protein
MFMIRILAKVVNAVGMVMLIRLRYNGFLTEATIISGIFSPREV